MKSLLIRAALLLLLVPGVARATDPMDPAETELRAADAKRIEAMVQGDTKALAPLLAPDLVYTHSTGEVQTREILLDTISSGRLDYLSMVPSDVRVRMLWDRAAVITGHADVKVIAQGKENNVALRFTSVWSRTEAGAWQMVAWQSTRLP
ncbi:MAG TPA: nuclear transport factor 2 family protein [Thermoanaerobaculia bacterium]|jgi:ketosteroid isomerase-like protein|nr:nuclear transport factor 2 family protein [Thermoanaerobaculia bacterium]